MTTTGPMCATAGEPSLSCRATALTDTKPVKVVGAEVKNTDSPETVVAAYFDAWRRNDIDSVRPLLHQDVDFVGILGSTKGVDETLTGLCGMFAMTQRVEVVHRWVDGPDVLTWFEIHTGTAGSLAVANWSHVEAGRIIRIRVTFDPRPLLG
jgi:ketosteroid isomerase-like protein